MNQGKDFTLLFIIFEHRSILFILPLGYQGKVYSNGNKRSKNKPRAATSHTSITSADSFDFDLTSLEFSHRSLTQIRRNTLQRFLCIVASRSQTEKTNCKTSGISPTSLLSGSARAATAFIALIFAASIALLNYQDSDLSDV